jgi:hypothetical protein
LQGGEREAACRARLGPGCARLRFVRSIERTHLKCVLFSSIEDQRRTVSMLGGNFPKSSNPVTAIAGSVSPCPISFDTRCLTPAYTDLGADYYETPGEHPPPGPQPRPRPRTPRIQSHHRARRPGRRSHRGASRLNPPHPGRRRYAPPTAAACPAKGPTFGPVPNQGPTLRREAPCCIPGVAGRDLEDIPGSDGLPGSER